MNFDISILSILGFSFVTIFQDLKSRRVSNKIIIIWFLVTLIELLFLNGWSGLISGFSGFLLVFISGFIFWKFSILGAGDVKVMSVIGLTIPGLYSLEFVFYAFVWGSLLGVIALALDKSLIQESKIFNFHPVMTMKSQTVKNHKIPFTVAIFFGILTFWVLQGKGVHFL